jgi:PadR family transcriptional regulator, regulatory protein PadR
MAGPQRVTAPTLQVLAAFMSDLSRADWYGRALAQHTGLGAGTVLQVLYRLEREYGWLQSRWEDQAIAAQEGRPPRRFYELTGLGQREAAALLQQRMSGLLRLNPDGGAA